jgi:probable F420-dependent oxidoreductase
MAVPRRFGVTVPIPGVPLHAHREWYEELAALGFTDVWSGEADSHDGFTSLALAAAWSPTLRGGIAIAPVFTRGPALLAQTAASMADAAPGRFALGIGASSPAIVERWNGIPFEHAFARTRDVLRFLRAALAGEKVTERYDTFEVRGFRLGITPEQPPPVLVAALRPGMLRLAGEEGDGAIVNWLSAEDVTAIAPYVGDKEIVARIFVAPTDDFDAVRTMASRMITSYLTVGAYARFQEWLGRGPALQPMWNAWAEGDRARALELVPDDVIDALVVWGSPERIRERVEAYAANGVTTTAPAILGRGDAVRATIRALAPRPDAATP